MIATTLVRVDGVSRDFGRGRNVVHAVRAVSFIAPARASWSRSRAAPGAGKTTLLNIIGGLDRPDRRPGRASAGTR